MELEEILKGLELSGGIVITGNSRRVINFLAAHNEAVKILKKQRLGLIVIYVSKQQFAGVKSVDCFINQV